MKWQGLAAALRSKWGRAALVALGVAAVGGVIAHLGPALILSALRRTASVFPLVFLLEACIVACTMLGLRTLYGPDKGKITTWDLTRAGLLGYVAMLLMPSGRTFAEATRAAVLARRSTPARAAFAAYQMQAACLLGNAFILVLGTAAAWWVVGLNRYTLAILANLCGALLVGVAMLFGGRFIKLGGLLGRLFPSIVEQGHEFDAHNRAHPPIPWVPTLWESLSRLFQTVQMMILVAAVGGQLSFLGGLITEGAHEVGATVGGLIPAQLGAAEVNLAFFAKALGVDSAGAVAVALAVHLAQLVWVLVGLAVGLFSGPTKGIDEASLRSADALGAEGGIPPASGGTIDGEPSSGVKVSR
jgi:hypothetical protein